MAGEIKGKDISGLPWAKFVKKYPETLPKLRNMRIMSHEEFERLMTKEPD